MKINDAKFNTLLPFGMEICLALWINEMSGIVLCCKGTHIKFGFNRGGCKHLNSFIFKVFVDKHGQVAGDSMTYRCCSS